MTSVNWVVNGNNQLVAAAVAAITVVFVAIKCKYLYSVFHYYETKKNKKVKTENKYLILCSK